MPGAPIGRRFSAAAASTTSSPACRRVPFTTSELGRPSAAAGAPPCPPGARARPPGRLPPNSSFWRGRVTAADSQMGLTRVESS
eukprot:5869738-Alexandrium_andersonii.AAC.1